MWCTIRLHDLKKAAYLTRHGLHCFLPNGHVSSSTVRFPGRKMEERDTDVQKVDFFLCFVCIFAMMENISLKHVLHYHVPATSVFLFSTFSLLELNQLEKYADTV